MLRTYTDTLPERIPLVDNDTFKPIKNHVIAEALKIESGSLYDEEFDSPADSTVSVLETVPDEPMVDTESADFDELDKRVFANRSWWTKEYKQARRYLYGNKKVKPDFKKARELLLLETEKGNGFAAPWQAVFGGSRCTKGREHGRGILCKSSPCFSR